MITSHTELVNYLNTIELGETKFSIVTSTESNVHLGASKFTGKDKLKNSNTWIDDVIYYQLGRKFSIETKSWYIPEEIFTNINKAIAYEALNMLGKCLDVKMPERTSLYKEYRYSINDVHGNNPEYLSDIISILNYYDSSKTDTTVKSNVIGLLTILRKKYGKPS